MQAHRIVRIGRYLVKLNNPLMGTETLLRCNNACISASNVKLNNPLMGTETEVLPLKGLL